MVLSVERCMADRQNLARISFKQVVKSKTIVLFPQKSIIELTV
jgi:hypothetical protein